ncbi:EEF1A lysine methyltransferase 3 [Astyanax mexicanus]|uniref:EEF1A lysine methyltransferase 3 n=1 Tax=Astyanax mexicanus TaxID=7994 RepID=A0A8B9KE57_ASTMX|nr:EEF1A lysine methyltransferase 3 [Astyanax mexicanus]KAG9260449.1 EEF1A lysine methyltransferase 3 [Astyanax mexicanus]
MDGEAGEVFPAEVLLFEDGFSAEDSVLCCGQVCTVRQVFSASLGVAASVWEAAIHLCRYFEKTSLDLKGKRVIELGAGTGFVGILAAKLGACVTMTDLPLVIPQAVQNIEANTPPTGWPAEAPVAVPLSWGRDQQNFPSDWDYVLGTDIIYMPETFPLLLDTLVHLCGGGATVYLSSKMRQEHGTQDFYDHWLPQRFEVELVQREPEENINIYRAVLRPSS